MSRPTIFLFDIDGTLITSGGAAGRALGNIFILRYGRNPFVGMKFAGGTDYAFFRRALEILGEPWSKALIDSLFADYLGVLKETLEASPVWRLNPGARACVEACAGAAVGLGTGNIEAAARVKLEPFDLLHHFGFGGFAEDGEIRADLIGAGLARGAAQLGRPLSECRKVIIGDTPKDVSAARAHGAETLAVCTGGATREALDALAPECLVDTLEDPAAIEFLLG